MSERHADIVIVAVFFALVAMTMSTESMNGFELVVPVVVLAGLAMIGQRSDEPFSPKTRRQLRVLVLIGAVVGAVVAYDPYGDPCFYAPAVIAVTGLTYLSLRVRLFAPPPGGDD